jgi:osmotically-inducible protein OsmY
MYYNIDVNVYEGRVLLIGSVANSSYMEKASKIAWSIKNVKEVINEIEVVNKGIRDSAKDIFVANAIRSRLLLERDVQSLNYIIDVNNGKAYLLGVAQSRDELDKAIAVAGSTKGVRKVINYVRIKTSAVDE